MLWQSIEILHRSKYQKQSDYQINHTTTIMTQKSLEKNEVLEI